MKEGLSELSEQLRQAETPSAKERLQVLYWLKQDPAPSISAIAKGVGKHRNTVQTWLSNYREGGVEGMFKIKKSPGGVRVIPQWAETALGRRLQELNHGFSSYGKVQQWLAETLGIEAEYHAVYQMTRYRLKAKLKVARPQNCKQDSVQREAFKQTIADALNLLSQYTHRVGQHERPIRYFAQDEIRFGLHTFIGRLITACGVKPIGQWQWLFKAFWLYGAVESATGESFFLQFSHVDTVCYQWFLDEFSQAYPHSLNILQVDNGRFHPSFVTLAREFKVRTVKPLAGEGLELFGTYSSSPSIDEVHA
ncbi:IS630 family transposase [Phormidium sp. CLA17]|uniref:IS630 family transposase n=1 Tax=Leptolyngbya sp. Cla-17 TaxID=2803751 RepID=UPI001933BA93|nr:IS630 family transposase [Leptolyngbya sp. Cla-17]MBM0742144.1 IS630 family transposase [Leptolyngbya sp. Cla-17]